MGTYNGYPLPSSHDRETRQLVKLGNRPRVVTSLSRILCEYQSQLHTDHLCKKAVQRLVLTHWEEGKSEVSQQAKITFEFCQVSQGPPLIFSACGNRSDSPKEHGVPHTLGMKPLKMKA